METIDIEKLRYPIGKFARPEGVTAKDITEWIAIIENFPAKLQAEIEGVDVSLRYRPGGWTIQQVVHHCADSHLNSFIRFKWALTEDTPTIKPYFEERWAELPDSLNAPVELSLQLLQGLHARWTILLKSLSAEELQRTFIHPEHERPLRLDNVIALYAWHCNHHWTHILLAKANPQ